MRLGLIAAIALVAGCSGPAGEEHESGRRIYNARCYFCHGYSGDARTVAASALDPKPRDFASASPAELDIARIRRAVADGRPGTAMAGFARIMSAEEIARVAAFVFNEFVVNKAVNTRYHTPENGWPNHERYRAAFAFATGEIAVDAPAERLSPQDAAGRRLYLSACVICHDRASAVPDERAFALRSVSYPPHNYPKSAGPDAEDPYELHEAAPKLSRLSARERRGESLFQANCAFCHAADGTGRNWIGAFIDPPPPDLTRPGVRARLTPARLREVVLEGVGGTSMPAWKSVLSETEVSAVIAYMERAFPHPATARRDGVE